MNLAREIINELDQGASYQQVANRYSWHSLAVDDKEHLWNEAEKRSRDSKASADLLFALYRMAQEKDRWDALRALGLIALRPDISRRQSILKTMQAELEGIRNSLSDTRPADVRRYKQCEADFYCLNARLWIESDNFRAAIQSYEGALAIYEKYAEEKASWVKGQIVYLESVQSRQQQLLPIELLQSERLRLQRVLEKFTTEIKRYQEALSVTQTQVEDLSHQKDDLIRESVKLAQDIDVQKSTLREWQKRIATQKSTQDELSERIRLQEACLHFLVALPQAAMAPLWVEVVRLALKQGEIDELARQALERLAPHFPQDAVPLLAEVAARSPEPFSVDVEKFQANATHWMALIAQARELEEQDLGAAARILVKAWDTFLASNEGDK